MVNWPITAGTYFGVQKQTVPAADQQQWAGFSASGNLPNPLLNNHLKSYMIPEIFPV